MTEDTFNLILRLATYDGDTAYENFAELVADFKNVGGMALNPYELKRIAYVAYTLGKNEGNNSEQENF